MKKRQCRICPPAMAKEDAWQIWRLPAEEGARYASEALGSQVSVEEVEDHLQKHKAEQPPYQKKSKKEALRDVERLTDTEKKMLRLLYRFPALDLLSLSLLFYDSGDRPLAWRLAGNATYKMLRREVLYRLYLSYLPGPGPRPKPDPGAIYFPGGASRAWMKEQTGKPVSRKQWVSGRGDFRDWQAAWEQWKSGRSLSNLLSVASPDEPGRRNIGSFRIRSEDIWSGQILTKKVVDPLTGAFRLKPDCIVGLQHDLAFTPLVIWSDHSSKKAEVIARDAYRSAGLYRSGNLGALREDFSLPITLIWSDGPGRVQELRAASGKWRSGAGRVLAADRDSALAKPDGAFWQDLSGGDPLPLEEALQRALQRKTA